jgi:hypothetical protein
VATGIAQAFAMFDRSNAKATPINPRCPFLVTMMTSKQMAKAEWQEHERVKRETARLIAALQAMPAGLVKHLNMNQLIKGLSLDLSYPSVLNIVKEYRKGLEVKEAMAGESKQTEEAGAQFVLERISAIITKGYAHLGDNEKVGAEDVQLMIYRELKAFDPSLLARNEKKRLPKQTPVKN